jgi:lysophospholipase L1-like esterase
MKIPKTWITIAIFCLLAVVPYFYAPFDHFRILEWPRVTAALDAWKPVALGRVIIQPRPVMAANFRTLQGSGGSNAATAPLPPSLLTGDYVGKNWPVRSDLEQILNQSPDSVELQDYGCGMHHFYAALLRTEEKQPGAITRISHFGDSPISGDLISGEARTLLQDKFGDAGHGYILVSKPWDFYYHENVSMEGGGWKVGSPVLPGGRGGAVGMGGASFTAGSPSAYSEIHTTRSGEGSAVARFVVYFRAQPNGGSFLASVDKGTPQEFSTQSDSKASDVATITVDDGPHRLKITPKGDGVVTLYGVALERTDPGVVYDTLGMLGGTVHHMTLFHEDTWSQDLANRKPDLVILNFGTNESNYGYLAFQDYVHGYETVIGRIHAALPDASILIMSPMDRGARNDDGDIVTIPSIPLLVAAQQHIARTHGVAFFDTFAVMGGMGTMARWYDEHPRRVTGDFTHPTYTGAQQLGTALVNALLKGYGEYKKDPGAPCALAPDSEDVEARKGDAIEPDQQGSNSGTKTPQAKPHHRRHHKHSAQT